MLLFRVGAGKESGKGRAAQTAAHRMARNATEK